MVRGFHEWKNHKGRGTRSGTLNGSSITLPNTLYNLNDNIVSSGTAEITVWFARDVGNATLDIKGSTLSAWVYPM